MTTINLDDPHKREWSLASLAFAAFGIGLLASLLNLLNFNKYPIFRAEVLLISVILLAIAAIAAAIYRLAQPRISFVITGIFAAIIIDFGADISRNLFFTIILSISASAWFQPRNALKLIIAAFGSVMLFQSVGLLTGYGKSPAQSNEAKRLQDPKTADNRLPPIIHLVLDSYMGLEGMNSSEGNFGNLRAEQEQFYLSRGFQIYPQTYSRHGKTVNSLPEFLSYGKGPHATQPRNVQFTVAPPLDYFLDLDRKGYRTSVRAPSFVDLCVNQPLTACNNYNRSDLSSMASSDLSATERAKVIGLTMLELSNFAAIITATVDTQIAKVRGSHERKLFNRTKLYSLTGFQQLDAFTRELASLKRGEVRFAHLLLPHDPYIMDDRCRLLPERQWIDEHGPADFATRDAAYARQTRCMTNGALRRLIAELDKTEAGRAAIVLIQGDHGSRTVDHVPLADGTRPSLRAMTMTHSAFFAVRIPGEPSASVQGRYALDELFGAFAVAGFSSAQRPVSHSAEVYLMDGNWIPRQRIALPEFTQKFTKN